MASRLKLQEILEGILETKRVYFQPPESMKMQYPAIRYSIPTPRDSYANDTVYKHTNRYEIIVIDEDPESVIAEKVSKLTYCSLDRAYPSDGLNHYVFTLYF